MVNKIQGIFLDIVKELLPLISFFLFVLFLSMAMYLFYLDHSSKFAILFSISLLAISLAFFVFPLGEFLFIHVLSTKLLNQFGYLALIFFTWSMAINYIGEENWDKKSFIVIFLIPYLVITFAIWLPNSVYIEENDVKLDDSLIIISVVVASLFITLIYFFLINSYQNSVTEKKVRTQLFLLISGFSVIVVAMILGYGSEILIDDPNLDSYSLFIAGLGFFLIIYAMFSDISLSRIKIISELHRAQIYLDNEMEELYKVKRILNHSQYLAKKFNLLNAQISINLSLIKLFSYSGETQLSEDLIDRTELLIKKTSDNYGSKDLKMAKKLLVFQTAGKELELEEKNVETATEEQLQDCINYIDTIIDIFRASTQI